ncbi:MAG: tryptophan-rich sensory protein [Planctomycetes bacterium]|nr:tryptophan-rich sensory protein [Planctomycetota bacterium]
MTREVVALPVFVLVTFLAAVPGALWPPGDWYAGLEKPAWNPPAWVFGPAWTLLYTLMAVAAWLVWRRGGFRVQRRPLTLYCVQLALNAAWTPVFFGAQEPGWALLVILALWALLLATLLVFRRTSGPAALLLVPYLAWVSFAAALNCALWRLN